MRRARHRWPSLRLLALTLAALLMAAAAPAWAGTLQIRDGANVLSEGDRSALRSEGAAYPFDVRVVTTSEHATAAELDRYVAAQVAKPDMVVVGVDPTHRHTAVHFGTDAHVR